MIRQYVQMNTSFVAATRLPQPVSRNSLKQRIAQHWFLFTLMLVLTIGFSCWRVLEPLAEAAVVRKTLVFCVMFLMALPLELNKVWQSVRRPWPVLLATIINFGILPAVAWVLSRLLTGDLALGVLVAAATPSTLASAAVWTRRAGGNDAVSLLVTIVTNLSCFIFTPLILYALTGSQLLGQSGELTLGKMIARLALLVVLPMTLAQLLRLHVPFARWATAHKPSFGVSAQLGVLSMVLLGSIGAARELSEPSGDNSLAVTDFMLMVAVVLTIHLSMLYLGHLLGRWTGIEREDRIAVGFSGSQKTLMVGLHVAVTYFGGLAILPMVTYHVGQLLVDTIIADRLRDQGRVSSVTDTGP